ncbi:MAG: prepilin-type N-terminal cleavage/methylation domain-containing protein [Kiritimatiellia bacterium]
MRPRQEAFTLVELMLAITILAAVTTITCMSFATVVSAWRRGIELTERLHRGDLVMEQLVCGLRSVYYTTPRHGFIMEDNGEDSQSSDRVSWVKVGTALVGRNWPAWGSPHRVEFWIDEVNGGKQAAVRAWRESGQRDDFDPKKIPPLYLSRPDIVTGFNCRVANKKDKTEGKIEWRDEWTETNRVPELIELTLFLKPLGEGEEPVQVKRLVDIRPLQYGLAARRSGERIVSPVSSETSPNTAPPPTQPITIPRPRQPGVPNPTTPGTYRPVVPGLDRTVPPNPEAGK